ncbi:MULTISPECIES: helix-turn-helix transcriptional regulator [Brevundimonas]|uniref:helix-turn-helix transcriptional regulator n=1 Tax=Brevundimonas sp. 357 TaxID=2555782 RepID=UPI001404947F|nr:MULTISPECIES: helix-turn-helix transcriptional regulator [Brevundimonas]
MRASDDQTENEARLLGEALAALRRERGLSQAEAGQKIGMTSQGWGLYEAGKRPGLFRPDVQRRLTGALDMTPEDLALAMLGAPATPIPTRDVRGLEARGRAFDGAVADRRRLRLETDELAPWAAAGTVLEYAPGRWPRRDQGCVIETEDGHVRVRIYERADEDEIIVRGAGGLDGIERMARAAVRAVSAVTARLDEE